MIYVAGTAASYKCLSNGLQTEKDARHVKIKEAETARQDIYDKIKQYQTESAAKHQKMKSDLKVLDKYLADEIKGLEKQIHANTDCLNCVFNQKHPIEKKQKVSNSPSKSVGTTSNVDDEHPQYDLPSFGECSIRCRRGQNVNYSNK